MVLARRVDTGIVGLFRGNATPPAPRRAKERGTDLPNGTLALFSRCSHQRRQHTVEHSHVAIGEFGPLEDVAQGAHGGGSLDRHAEKSPIVQSGFQVVEEMPRFPGCEKESNKAKRKECANKKMLEFIIDNIFVVVDYQVFQQSVGILMVRIGSLC